MTLQAATNDNVIGPIDWTAEERLASWFTMRELRDDMKQMRSRDPVKFAGAIEREQTIVNQEFQRYIA